VEGDEVFQLRLLNGTAPVGGGSATIFDNEPRPRAAAHDIVVAEGDAGTTNAVFTVTLSAPSTAPVMLNYATSNSSAVAGSDYTAVSGTLTFAPGVTTQTVSVPILGDTIVENSEELFSLNLSSPINVILSDSGAVASIIDNDAAAMLAASVSQDEEQAAGVTQHQLDELMDAAVMLWTDGLGANDPRLALLADTRVGTVNLPANEIGHAEGNVILLDADAAGHGWFIDVSPMQSSEFSVRLDRNVFGAARSSEAFGRMDLLTVLLHEIGHVLGFGHDDAARYAVMHEELEAGARYALAESKPGPKAGVAGARISWDARVDWDADYAHWQVPGKRGPVPNFAGFRVRF
jgi:hypothetical protein